jgi:RIO kinase 1
MHSPLDNLVTEGILDDVLGRLKSGKEADVFRVVYRGEVVVAKVYKDRDQRSFKNNAAYKEGRTVRNSRTQRAMEKGSRFGRGEDEDEWKASEARCLHRLHAAGVRVPTPVMFYEGVLLMELVADAEGNAAPRLVEAAFDPTLAAAYYRDLRGQIVKMLCCDLIHGDLSPYNVLLAAAGPTIIDFPQTVSAAHNSQSETFFRRDFDGIQQFFARIDRSLLACNSDGHEIWKAYVRRELSPDYVPAPVAREQRPGQAQYVPRGQQGPRPGGARPPQSYGGGGQAGPAPQRSGPSPQRPGPLPPRSNPSPSHGPPPSGSRGPNPPLPPRSNPSPSHGPPPSGSRGPNPPPPSGSRPPRTPAPVVSYVQRPPYREPGPSSDRATAAPPPKPAAPPPPDGNPHRKRRRHRP